jgi:magnesium-protoporphyrin IX monomethyl ester (oxidative) cyclase
MKQATMINSAADAAQKAVADKIYSPRFYTTDFDAMDKISIEPVRAEWDAMMAEYEADDNRDYFRRDASFAAEVRELDAKMSPEMKQEFLDFLVTTLTSELSGCILYNDIKRNVSNPDIKRLMHYMARDEARHASFVNSALKDYGLGINAGDLKRNKKFTFFKPKYVFYATYLSEKIGYARYIKIFRQLEAYPEKRFHPVFRWFQRWCNDEFRHGESIALIMRANPELLKGPNLLLIRFFLLAVYATMYVRDHMRPALKRAIGLNPTDYDFEVFRITNEIIKQCLPILPDIENPAFQRNLDRISYCVQRGERAAASTGLFGKLGKAFWNVAGAAVFVRMYCIPMQSNQLPEFTLMQPSW